MRTLVIVSTFLKVILFLAYTEGNSAQFCSSSRSPQFQLTLDSYRNATGQWVAQVILEHGTEHKDAGPWRVNVDHSTARCDGKEAVRIIATVTGPPNRAGPGYELIPGLGYYKFHTDMKTWFEARQICAQEGAHLFIPNSAEEAKSMDLFWARHPNPENAHLQNWAHIGMHDLNHEGEWETILNQPLNTTGYTTWLENEPNGGTTEDCGIIHRQTGKLADVQCSLPLYFICEQEL